MDVHSSFASSSIVQYESKSNLFVLCIYNLVPHTHTHALKLAKITNNNFQCKNTHTYAKCFDYYYEFISAVQKQNTRTHIILIEQEHRHRPSSSNIKYKYNVEKILYIEYFFFHYPFPSKSCLIFRFYHCIKGHKVIKDFIKQKKKKVKNYEIDNLKKNKRRKNLTFDKNNTLGKMNVIITTMMMMLMIID